jgi:hypothetical protein
VTLTGSARQGDGDLFAQGLGGGTDVVLILRGLLSVKQLRGATPSGDLRESPAYQLVARGWTVRCQRVSVQRQ